MSILSSTTRRAYQKLRRTYREVSSAVSRRTRFPITLLYFDIVSTCQLKCLGCPNSTLSRDLAFMSVDHFAQCLGNIDVPRIRGLNLFRFSESFLHPDLAGMLLQVPRQRWKTDSVRIYTNAQHCDEEQLKDVFETGVLDRLHVSCDGDGTPASYERARPPAKWDRLVHFLTKARELRDRYAPNLFLATETCCDSAAGQERWTRLLRPLGWEPSFRGYFAMADSAKNLTGRQLVVPDAPCWSVYPGYLFVDYDGTVVPCCAHPRAAEFGNLRTDRYSTIFLGQRRREFIESLERNRRDLDICGKCEVGIQ